MMAEDDPFGRRDVVMAVLKAMRRGDVAIVQHEGARGQQGAVIAVRHCEDAENDEQQGKCVHGWAKPLGRVGRLGKYNNGLEKRSSAKDIGLRLIVEIFQGLPPFGPPLNQAVRAPAMDDCGGSGRT